MTTILAQAQETLFAQHFLQLLVADADGALDATAANAMAEFQAATARELARLAELLSPGHRADVASEPDRLAAPLSILDLMAAVDGDADASSERLAALSAAAHTAHESIVRLGEQVRRYAVHAAGNP
jgi:hypothetical protein